jgi:hypothetical protein
MSLTKLLSRVVAPDEVDYETMTYKKKVATAKLHKFTFGITSDPLTQFAWYVAIGASDSSREISTPPHPSTDLRHLHPVPFHL